jgi:hypothetical protein
MRCKGFRSCVVRCPPRAVEHALERHYARPVTADAAVFIDELLARCLLPRRRASEIAALPELDRARLRRAVVAVCEMGSSWRALYGSHLTHDERLLSVMVWRHEQLEGRCASCGSSDAGSAGAVSRVNDQSQARPMGVSAALRAADARRRTTPLSVGSIGKVPRHLFDYPKLAASLFPDLSKTIVGRVLVGRSAAATALAAQSAAVNALAARTAAATTDGLDRAFPVCAATVAALSTVRAARLVVLPKVELPTLVRTASSAKPPWWQSLDKASSGSGAVATQNLYRATADIRRHENSAKLGLGPVSCHMGVASLVAQMTRPTLMLPDFAGRLRGLFDPMAEWRETWHEAGRFVRRWEQTAIWFLLSGLGFAVSQPLGTLNRAEVEAVVLDALESVVADGEFVAALRQAVAEAPYLGDSQRLHLDHMLEHAAEGEWVYAAAPLYPGLEGAFWQAAYEVPVVTPERMDVTNPNKQLQFETMVKRLGLEQEFVTFVVRSLFGTAGNPFRHGGANCGERRQVLFGVAALAGWIEQFAGAPALNVLGTRMSAALPAAIDRATQTRTL